MPPICLSKLDLEGFELDIARPAALGSLRRGRQMKGDPAGVHSQLPDPEMKRKAAFPGSLLRGRPFAGLDKCLEKIQPPAGVGFKKGSRALRMHPLKKEGPLQKLQEPDIG
jgi:hypothetical protein